MIRIAICDDSTMDREIIASLLGQYFEDKSIVYQMDPFENGMDMIHEIVDGQIYDIVFLDIYMDKMLGIDVARKLRSIDFSGEIIFLTATSEFAVDSYDVEAGGYLLKPHSYEKLSTVMNRVLENFDINTYQIKSRNRVARIPYNEILYVESSNTKCIFHCQNDKKYTVYKKLGKIEEELNDPRFLRCHQSYLVNMSCIQHVDSHFTLFTGDTVMIRQRSLREIRSKYLSYIDHKRT